ncbi:hypothetical protein AB2M62_14855 [Sphingomonas sp. MMS12-HWE2-04]|uniref:hypothetical protein n=1 Tax=Sphingomonas sp. MMS12-HWE2-04 TaxID=3234199 RepID=UPI00384D0B2E
MTMEVLAASVAAPPPRITDLAPAMPQTPGLGTQIQFDAAMSGAAANPASTVQATGDVPPAVKEILNTLDKVDGEAKGVADYASSAQASNGELTPGEIVQLTMRCQEFMFHCQLSSNIANRSSDGIQQLFKQQG